MRPTPTMPTFKSKLLVVPSPGLFGPSMVGQQAAVALQAVLPPGAAQQLPERGSSRGHNRAAQLLLDQPDNLLRIHVQAADQQRVGIVMPGPTRQLVDLTSVGRRQLERIRNVQ